MDFLTLEDGTDRLSLNVPSLQARIRMFHPDPALQAVRKPV